MRVVRISEALSAQPSGHAVPARSPAADGLAFHLWMAAAVALVLLISVIGCRLTQVHVEETGALVVALVLLVTILQALPLYLHRKGLSALRDSLATVLWAALLWRILPFPVDVAARLSRAFPLRDALLARLDAHLGVNIAAVAHWTAQHWIFHAFDDSYALLEPLLILAFVLPGLTGKAIAVKRLLVANLAAFAIGVPIFAFVPAIGPWYGEHFAPDRAQAICEAAALRLRDPAPYEHQPAGVICFPSFHVMWALLCAATLAATFRWLRLPAWILAGLIVVSTMTTGWHYFVDVLGGFALAGIAMVVAWRLVRS